MFPAGVCGGDQPEGELEENWCVPAAQEDERAGGGRATGEALKVKSLIVTSSTDSEEFLGKLKHSRRRRAAASPPSNHRKPDFVAVEFKAGHN